MEKKTTIQNNNDIISQEVEKIKPKIRWISVDQLYPHQDNPRKDLGDLSELAESIKTNGIYQNLTVVPCTNGYTVIIGHRRLAAAKLAGVEAVPCLVKCMTEQEQIATMLLENMQRSDLTVYEQAQGFQLMIDFGETVSSISKKTGFSESTIRRRTKLLKLDKDKFKSAELRGATLEDYAKLDEIDDENDRNECLEAIGTSNFDWKLRQAKKRQQERQWTKETVEALKTFAVETDDDTGLQFVTSFYSWNSQEKPEKPDDAGERKYFYKIHITSISLYRKPTEEETASKEARVAELEKKEAERKERRAKIEELGKLAYERRTEFMRSYVYKFEHLPIFAAVLLDNIDGYLSIDTFDILRHMGIYVPEDTDDMLPSALLPDEKAKQAIALMAYAVLEDSESYIYCDYYGKYRTNDHLGRIYDFLIRLGYEMSDEEMKLHDGSHPLYAAEN